MAEQQQQPTEGEKPKDKFMANDPSKRPANFKSNRNLAKKLRRPREIYDEHGNFKKFHQLDTMRLSDAAAKHIRGVFNPFTDRAKAQRILQHAAKVMVDKPVNTTGSYGVLNTFTVRVQRFGPPGRNRQPRKRKNVSKLFVKNIEVDFSTKSRSQLKNLRDDLMTVKTMQTFLGKKMLSESHLDVLSKITSFLMRTSDKNAIQQMLQRDEQRRRSAIGMMRTSNINVVAIKSLDQRIRKAIANMQRTQDA